MVLSTISASEIYLAINNFKPKVSRDELDISMKLIQEISSSIIVPLMYIFKKSFDDGLFPSFFKRSKIIPIFKSGDCNDFNNYRPISLTLQFSKMLEKLFSNRLLSFCNKFNIINDEQFGYRKNISTLNSIETLQKKVIESLDSYCVGLFVDLKKAFDTVNHRILINKLYYYGIRGKPLDWLINDRQQFVQYNESKSDIYNICYGVPQGSIRGPLLFSIFMNDMILCSPENKFILFADDTNVIICDKSSNNLNHKLQSACDDIFLWSKLNKLSINIGKTHCMSFKNDIIFNINIYNTLLFQVTSTKCLGINLDTCLNWKCQLAYLKNILLKILWIIKNVSYFVNTSAMIKLYYALFYPHLIDCIEIWGHGYVSNLNSIYLIQKKILKIIFTILSLYDIYKYKTCIYMYLQNIQ